MTPEVERLARVHLLFSTVPGDRDVAELVDAEGPVAAADRLSCDWREVAARRLEAAEERGRRLVVPGDEEWPAPYTPVSSDCLFVPPVGLWVRGGGRLGRLARRAVVVSGSPQASPYGADAAAEMVGGLARRGWSVLTFGRFGIDGAAARAALAGGIGVVVFRRGGHGRTIPAGHAVLFDRLSSHGVLVSEWAVGSPPGATVARDADLAARLAAGVVLIEPHGAGEEEQLVRAARQLRRPLLAVPGPVTSELSAYSHKLIRQRRARLVTGWRDVLGELRSPGGQGRLSGRAGSWNDGRSG